MVGLNKGVLELLLVRRQHEAAKVAHGVRHAAHEHHDLVLRQLALLPKVEERHDEPPLLAVVPVA